MERHPKSVERRIADTLATSGNLLVGKCDEAGQEFFFLYYFVSFLWFIKISFSVTCELSSTWPSQQITGLLFPSYIYRQGVAKWSNGGIHTDISVTDGARNDSFHARCGVGVAETVRGGTKRSSSRCHNIVLQIKRSPPIQTVLFLKTSNIYCNMNCV
jgi:hypothetical protein